MKSHRLYRRSFATAVVLAVGCFLCGENVRPCLADGLRDTDVPGQTRSPLYGSMAVSSGQPIASRVGIDVLRDGGNAADAAVAMAAALAVLEPMLGGPGGDVSILYWDEKAAKLFGLDSRGRAPKTLFPADEPKTASTSTDTAAPPTEQTASAKAVAPSTGALSWTTPGAVDGWNELHQRFGTKAWDELLTPAIQIAEDGFPVSPATAQIWQSNAERLTSSARDLFAPGGKTPAAGDIFRNPDLSRALKQIASGGRAVFYEGEVGQTLVAFGRGLDGQLSLDDLASHRSVWVSPIAVDYRENRVATLPTSGLGVSALETLGVLNAFDLAGIGRGSAQYWHLVLEAKKGAATDASVGAQLDAGKRLGAEWLAEKRRSIDPNKATPVAAGCEFATQSPTSSLIVVDAGGNACVLVQDLGHCFGSGVVPGALGFVVQNRAAGQTADSSAEIGHGRLPMAVLKDEKPILLVSACSKGAAIEQSVQAVVSSVDLKTDAQSTLDLPRVSHAGTTDRPTEIIVEAGIADAILEDLKARGHILGEAAPAGVHGDIQVIAIEAIGNGKRARVSVGSDPRRDAMGLAF